MSQNENDTLETQNAENSAASDPNGPSVDNDFRPDYAKMLASARVQNICLITLTVLAVGAMTYVLRNVLLPFVLSVFLTFVLNPVVRFCMSKLRMPRVLAILVTIVLSLGVLVGLAAFVSSSFLQLANEASRFTANIESLLDKFFEYPVVKQYGFEREAVMGTLGVKMAEGAGQLASVLVSGIFSLLSQGVVVAIYLMFLLFGSKQDVNPNDTNSLWDRIRLSIESYISLKTVLSGVMAALTWLILAALGVKMAAVIALLAFAFNFVPNVGPIAASLVPIPVMLLSGQSEFAEILLAVLLPGLIHFVVGHLVEPKVMGNSLDLDPVVILLGLMLAELMWGPVGMLLAMPLMVVARILLAETAAARPLVNLLAGKFPGNDAEQTE